jgi:hypothetical protein
VGELVGLGVGVTVGVVVLVLVGEAVGETVGVGLGPTWFDDTTMPTMIPATTITATIATMIQAERDDFFFRPLERGVYDTMDLQVLTGAGQKNFPYDLASLKHAGPEGDFCVKLSPDRCPDSRASLVLTWLKTSTMR